MGLDIWHKGCNAFFIGGPVLCEEKLRIVTLFRVCVLSHLVL